MGILKKRNKVDKNELTEYQIQSEDKMSTIHMFDINDKRTVKGRNDEIIKLVTARVKKFYSKKGNINVIAEDYIVFEIPGNQELTQIILETAIAEYEYARHVFSNEGVYYLGKFTTSKYGYYFQISLVDNIVEEIISEMQKEILKAKNKQREEKSTENGKSSKHRDYLSTLKVGEPISILEDDRQGEKNINSREKQEHRDI